MKKIRRKVWNDPAHASEAPMEAVPAAAATTMAPMEEPKRGTTAEVPTSGDGPAETAPVKESREGTPAEVPVSEGASAEVAPTEVEERGQPAPAETTIEGSSVALAPTVVDLEAGGEDQVNPRPAGGNEPGAGEAEQVPPKPAGGGATKEAERAKLAKEGEGGSRGSSPSTPP